MDQWDQSAFEIAFNAWNFELIEIFVRFYKARQRDLNPSFFKDMANSRPNSGPHDEGYFDILTNLVRQNEFEECHCKDNICKIQEMCELMVSYDEDDYENDENNSNTDSSSYWETIISESSDDDSESSEKEAFVKACREDPLLRNRIYLIIACALLKKE